MYIKWRRATADDKQTEPSTTGVGTFTLLLAWAELELRRGSVS